MKTRGGFVSNSSSSSFIVIDPSPVPDDYRLSGHEGKTITLGLEGEAEFGWGPETLYDVHDRLNFTYLQALYFELQDVLNLQLERLNAAIIRRTGATDVRWMITTSYIDTSMAGAINLRWGYIDHQSHACNGENMQMFESDDSLDRFLFGANSKIHLDNDNR